MNILSKYVVSATQLNRQKTYECECLEFATLLQQTGKMDEQQFGQQAINPGTTVRNKKGSSLFTLLPVGQLIRASLAAIP